MGSRPPSMLTEHAYREETERVLREAASQPEGCVILGRTAAIVLRDHPTALFVCLEGSFERRVHLALAHSTDTEAQVRRFLLRATEIERRTSTTSTARDPNDAHLSHLVIDSTVLSLETTIDLIVTATRDRI